MTGTDRFPTPAPAPLPARRSRLRRLALWCAVLLVLAYVAAVGTLWWTQEQLLFDPGDRDAKRQVVLPADVHETWVDVPGARLDAWQMRLPRPVGVVFLLHGNGVDMHNWLPGLEQFRRANFDVFMIDYRGFGKSTGSVRSQQQLEADVLAAWNQMLATYTAEPPQTPAGQPFRHVIFGRSLGTGPAAILAAREQPDLTVLVTPYASMTDLARLYYRWVPLFALRYPLRTDKALAEVKTPVLLLHGDADTLIPLEHSQRLKALARQAQLVVVPKAGHEDIQKFSAYREGLAAALAGLVDAGTPAAASVSAPASASGATPAAASLK